jgi:hypothetical protein
MRYRQPPSIGAGLWIEGALGALRMAKADDAEETQRWAYQGNNNVNTAWTKADLLFLMDALKRGVAEAYVARFLGRSAGEVRDQAKALTHRKAPP